MKKITSFIATVTLTIAFSATASAQVTASAPTTATVVAPISILKVTDMSFGNVAVSSTLGTAVLLPASTRTKTGGVTLPGTTGTVTAASFTIGGDSNYTFVITLPTTDFTITKATTNETMIVNAFNSTPSGTGTLVTGAATVLVGATLNVGGAQVAGIYANAAGFPVTVNYN
jgi:hypothetical protein